ncbi:MAG TPA: ABC transporter permease [Gemmatimonadaceae bacterium]|nr:ABC transporter permease [Gemmatimonadaceae bacterium]
MDKLKAIIRREYLERVRTKWFIIATLLGPVMFLALTVLPILFVARTKPSAASSNFTIIDATGVALGQRVLTELRDTAAVGPTITVVGPGEVAAAESLATSSIMTEKRVGYLVLDTATLGGKSARYTGRNSSTVPEMRRISTAIEDAVLNLRLEKEGITAARIDSLTKVDIRLEKTQLSSKGRERAGAGTSIVGLMMSFLLYIVLLLYGQTVLRSVIEEKATRVAEVVISSVRPEILLAGKIIGIGAVAVTQLAVWIGSSAWIGSTIVPMLVKRNAAASTAADVQTAARSTEILASLPSFGIGFVLAVLFFFVLGYVFYACLYAAVGSTVNSESEAQQAATPVAMLLIVSAIFIQPVALAPQSTLSSVMSMLPFSAPIMMPMRMSIMAVPPWQVAVSMIGMALACVGAVWFSARIYRVGLLMYGKRPTLRELFKWLRYA